MRQKILICATLAALLAACGKKTETPAPPPPGPDKIVAPAKPIPFDCDLILPKEVRAKYFPDSVYEPVTPKKGTKTLDCVFKKGTVVQMVQVMCDRKDDGAIKMVLDEAKAGLTDIKDVSGIGKYAYMGMAKNEPVLRFRDDDTYCYGTILAVPGAEELAKTLVATLKPENVK
jgi:hypothetical protein